MLNHSSGCLCLDGLSWLQPRKPGVSVASELTKSAHACEQLLLFAGKDMGAAAQAGGPR